MMKSYGISISQSQFRCAGPKGCGDAVVAGRERPPLRTELEESLRRKEATYRLFKDAGRRPRWLGHLPHVELNPATKL